MWRPALLLAVILLPVALLGGLILRFVLPSHEGLAAAIVPLTALSQSSIATSTTSIVSVLQQLEDQNQMLATEVADLRSQAEMNHLEAIFPRTLQYGDTGDDVKALQSLLSSFSNPATSSTTGFYGDLTVAAVKSFQTQSALPPTGVFDTLTKSALATFVQNHSVGSTTQALVPIDFSTLVDPQQNDENLEAQILQLSSEIATSTNIQTEISELASEISDLQNSVSTIASTPAPTPTPAPTITLPLAISNIQLASSTKSTATITWTTNNPSTSEVDYSTNSSMPVGQTLTIKSPTTVTSHTAVLPSLTAATTYYYHIISEDVTSTVANSTNLTFTTLSH